MKFKKNGGFTLVELTIVMALLVLVTGIIVSFTVLTGNHISESNLRSDFLNSTATLKNDLVKDFSEIDEKETFTVTVNDEKKILTVSKKDSLPEISVEINLSNYTALDEIDFEIIEDSHLLKIKLSNNTLKWEQTFTLMSKTNATFQKKE